MKFDVGHVAVHKRDRLPHWDVEHGIQFVTFNLFDALPGHIRQRIREEADAQIAVIRNTRGQLTTAEKLAIEHWVQVKIGETLDQPNGVCFMRDARIAKIVANAITFFDAQRYRLLGWCVMPNHVHVILKGVQHLDRVIHSWKSFTAKSANKLLGRTGAFWQDGYYDRTIRDSEELSRTIEYVSANPAKAGLLDWPFVKVYPERIAALLSPGETPGEGGRDARPPI